MCPSSPLCSQIHRSEAPQTSGTGPDPDPSGLSRTLDRWIQGLVGREQWQWDSQESWRTYRQHRDSAAVSCWTEDLSSAERWWRVRSSCCCWLAAPNINSRIEQTKENIIIRRTTFYQRKKKTLSRIKHTKVENKKEHSIHRRKIVHKDKNILPKRKQMLHSSNKTFQKYK